MKRALVLSGGGCRGAFEVGAVEYLVREAGLNFQIFLGTSVGALNSGLLGQSRNRKELLELTQRLKELWLSIEKNADIYHRSCFGVFRLLFRDSLYNPKGLWQLLQKYIDPNRLYDPATVVKVATVAQESGELFYADSRDPKIRGDILKYILASASMPLFFPGVPIGDKHWYDGGLRDITPLGAAFAENPDEIVVITTFPVKEDLRPNLPKVQHGNAIRVIQRTIDILTSEISANDLELADAINQERSPCSGRCQVPIWVISPQEPLPGDNVLTFSPPLIREYMKLGCQAAHQPRILQPQNLKQPVAR